MAHLDVVQLVADDYPHLRAFDEVAASLAEGLRAAGHRSTLLRGLDLGPGRNVVLGGHLLEDGDLGELPPETIFYNFEQVDPTSMLPPARLRAFGRFEVWEYSRKNLERWAAAGLAARHVPVGWSPGLEVLRPLQDPPIDVLFYGSVNERRRDVLVALQQRGLWVEARFGLYGAERDRLIEQAKVVLNVHYYEARILEIVRLSFPLANGVAVVSEWSGDLEVPDGIEEAARFAVYDELVDATVALVGDTVARRQQGAAGRAAMRALPWAIPDLTEPRPAAAGSPARRTRPVRRSGGRRPRRR